MSPSVRATEAFALTSVPVKLIWSVIAFIASMSRSVRPPSASSAWTSFVSASIATILVLAVTAASAAVWTLVFIVAVKSPLVGALVRLVTVVIVPAVIFVGVARPFCIFATASAFTPAAVSQSAVTAGRLVSVVAVSASTTPCTLWVDGS